MIKEKKTIDEPVADELPVVTVPEEVEGNALAEMYLVVKRAVLAIREREDDRQVRRFSRPYPSTTDSSHASL